MISGVDEAGRGPVIGPLVIAGVTFENDSELIKNKIRDSKRIAPKRREELARWIQQSCLKYEIITISADDIDDMRKVMTLNKIEVNAFAKLIETLKPEICYVDAADVKDFRFGRDIASKISFNFKIISEHKADDKYPIVGAASILAKTKRDHEIKIIEQKLEKKLKLPLGSGYPADPITIRFLKTWIESYNEIPPYTRKSWKTVQKIINVNKIKKIDDF